MDIEHALEIADEARNDGYPTLANQALCFLADHVRKLSVSEEYWRIGFDRYETARRMNPQQWAEAWALNISTGKPFDEIIDNLRPFMTPNAKVSGAGTASAGLPGCAASVEE